MILESGSSYTLISLKADRKINAELRYSKCNPINWGNKTTLVPLGYLDVKIQLGHKEIQHAFRVCNNLACRFIIGNDITFRNGIVTNLTRSEFHFNDSPSRKYPSGNAIGNSNVFLRIQERVSSEFDQKSQEGQIEALLSKYPTVCNEMVY